MASAGQDARERAHRLRLVLEECERVMGDPSASPERREVAERWHHRLGGIGSLADNAYHSLASAGTRGAERHTNGGGQSLNLDADYDGWGTP